MPEEKDDKKALEMHRKIKENIKDIIAAMNELKTALTLHGIEYDFHIEIQGERVLGGVTYDGLLMSDKGVPEIVDLNFEGDQVVIGKKATEGPKSTVTDLKKEPEPPKLTNAQLVDAWLKEITQ